MPLLHPDPKYARVRSEFLHIGTAGWQLPKPLSAMLHGDSQLERYASVFNAVEVNSTFYRPHLRKTFERWAASVPEDLRFAVKMYTGITHLRKLADIGPEQEFLEMVQALGDRLGPVLIQLPPSHPFTDVTGDLLTALREVYDGTVVLEPRHLSWATGDVSERLEELRIARVAADPPLITDRMEPGGYGSCVYFRLHGSPRVYWSAYEEEFLQKLAVRIAAMLAEGIHVWVIFDNTAYGSASTNAIQLQQFIAAVVTRPAPGLLT